MKKKITASSATASTRKPSRACTKLSAIGTPLACNACGSGVGHGMGDTDMVPRVSQSMFLISARMISEMPMVAMAR